MMADVVQITAGIVVSSWASLRANAHRADTPWLDRLTVALIGAAGVLAVLAVPLSRAPVIVDVRAEVVQHTAGVARVRVFGTKPASAALCDFLWLDAYIGTRTGELVEAPMSIEADPRAGSTRPPGRHDFGTWRVDYPPNLQAASVTFTAHHRCAWWMPVTRSNQGPFALPELQDAAQ